MKTVKNQPRRNSWGIPKWLSITIVCVLFVVACSSEPTAVVTATPSRVVTKTVQDTAIVETEEVQTTFIPMITREVSSCTYSSFGTMLIETNPGDWITPADVMIFANDEVGIKGLAATGSPSNVVRDEWFGKLSGWTRAFIRGKYEQLIPIHEAATVFGMQDMYECIGYGPESTHQADDEALAPLTWVPMAEAVAESAGKCLIYGPAVLDYERLSTPDGGNGPDYAVMGELITNVAPHVDIWMIQLAKYQRWTDGGHDDSGNPFTINDFTAWARWWVTQIKSSNPDAKVWTQLGIGVYDPMQDTCLPSQEPGYIVNYRNALMSAGVDGVFVMPSQPCQNSIDAEDHEYYLQSLYTLQLSIDSACGN
jgi:hypothetical protein